MYGWWLGFGILLCAIEDGLGREGLETASRAVYIYFGEGCSDSSLDGTGLHARRFGASRAVRPVDARVYIVASKTLIATSINMPR